MTAKENRPGVGTEAAKVLAGGLNDSSLNDTTVVRSSASDEATARRAKYPDRIELSAQFEDHLDGLAMDLVLGFAHYYQLSPALMQLWEFAYQQGRASRDTEVAELEHEASRYYFEMSIRQPRPRGEYLSWDDLQERRAKREAEAAGHYPGGDLKGAWGISND